MNRFLLCLLGLAAMARSVFSQEDSYTGVFKTTAFMALEWAIQPETPLSEYPTEDVFQIETGASTYFSQILADNSVSAFQTPNEFVDASVAVRRQRMDQDNGKVVVETKISVYHYGTSGIADLSDLLRFVTNKNTTGSEEFLALDTLIGMNVKVSMVSFTNAKNTQTLAGGFSSSSSVVVRGKSDRTLVAVTTILAFALLGLSVILVWMAGGWISLRKQLKIMIKREEEEQESRLMKQIQQKMTEDTADEEAGTGKDDDSQTTTPSGIKGVNQYLGKTHGLGVKMTPPGKKNSESDLESDFGTPMSVYSDTDRVPIGITSMRKLLANRSKPEDALYGVKSLDYGE